MKKIFVCIMMGMVLSFTACDMGNPMTSSDENDTDIVSMESNENADQQDSAREEGRHIEAIGSADDITPSIATDTSPEECLVTEAELSDSDGLTFETVDVDGNQVTDEMIRGSKLVLLNLWEPWCGPCVREMPELQKLYQTYKDRGLLIIGVYTADGAKEIVESSGVLYPVIQADKNLFSYEQNYVPATFLFDGDGKLLENDPIEGARSYDQWEAIVLKYLSE